MGSSEDKVNQEMKLFRQLSENTKRNADEEKEYNRLLMLYGQEVLEDAKLIQEKQKDVVYVAPEVPKNDLKAKNDLDALMKAYKDKTGKDPIQTEKGTALFFSSRAEAVEFFKEQSKKLAFDAYNKEDDHRVYSDGKGTFVHGTEQQVSDYLKHPEDFNLGKDGKLEKKDEPEDTHTHTHRM